MQVQTGLTMDISDMNIVFADKLPPSIDPTGTLLKSIKAERKWLDARSVVLLVVSGILLVFFLGNFALYAYARKSLPTRVGKKKPLSAKKLKKEKLKLSVSSPGE